MQLFCYLLMYVCNYSFDYCFIITEITVTVVFNSNACKLSIKKRLKKEFEILLMVGWGLKKYAKDQNSFICT